MTKEFLFQVGDVAPDFTLTGDDGKQHRLSSFRGQKLVLYFYPKDDTPGCTQEACDFRDTFSVLKQSKITVVGVSPDSVDSHVQFKAKYQLPFLLLSDPESTVAKRFGAFGQKNLYGKISEGILRTTFIIDEQGKFAKIYPKVSVKGHVSDVVESLI